MVLRVFAVIFVLLYSTVCYADKRIALVVGNFSYTSDDLTNLSNPGNDARRMAQLLQKRNFTLVGNGALLNLTKQEFDRAVRSYGQLAQNADVTVFYYSGHGMQVGGINYLVPSDASAPAPYNLRTDFMSADTVMWQIDQAKSKLNFFLLDACRNNPFRSMKATMGDGLAEMRAPIGTIIGFATQPGNTAGEQEASRNSACAG